MGVITVKSGANETTVSAGMTVAEVRQNTADVLNLDDGVEARINGDLVADDYVLEDDDVLEFIKPAGTKGT